MSTSDLKMVIALKAPECREIGHMLAEESDTTEQRNVGRAILSMLDHGTVNDGRSRFIRLWHSGEP